MPIEVWRKWGIGAAGGAVAKANVTTSENWVSCIRISALKSLSVSEWDTCLHGWPSVVFFIRCVWKRKCVREWKKVCVCVVMISMMVNEFVRRIWCLLMSVYSCDFMYVSVLSLHLVVEIRRSVGKNLEVLYYYYYYYYYNKLHTSFPHSVSI